MHGSLYHVCIWYATSPSHQTRISESSPEAEDERPKQEDREWRSTNEDSRAQSPQRWPQDSYASSPKLDVKPLEKSDCNEIAYDGTGEEECCRSVSEMVVRFDVWKQNADG
jgi:hypothetical protein